MQKTTYHVQGMDCPAEASLIQLALGALPAVHDLEFDLESRTLTIYHHGELETIEDALFRLKLGGEKFESRPVDERVISSKDFQRRILIAVLVINFVFFIIEITAGWISHSMGLVADSLDMLADAFVYGLSLFAVGESASRKKRVARVAGYFQLLLAVIGFAEVIRRFISVEVKPDYLTMVLVSSFALAGNAISLFLLQKSKSREAHIQASMIFTSNDVIINIGVIAAGILVNILGSSIPDLIAGTIVFLLVTQGALRILKLGK